MDTRPMVAMAAALVLSGSTAQAQETNVDVALVLAGDASGSMDQQEREMQRQGFAATFRHPDMLSIIVSGAYGKVAVTYVEWAGPAEQWVTVPWAIISDRASAEAFAAALTAAPEVEGTHTSVSMGLLFAAAQFRSSPVTALRQTIDISGNGPNSAGPPVATARDFVLAMGITINGLTFTAGSVADAGPYGYLTERDDLDLDRYYEDCVIGGAGAFAMHAGEVGDLIAVIRRKVALEIAGLPAVAEYAEFPLRREKTVDCSAKQ